MINIDVNDLSSLERLYDNYFEIFNKSNDIFLERDLEKINEIIKVLKSKIEEYDLMVLKLSLLIEFNKLIEKGFTKAQIRRWHQEDNKYLEKVQKMIIENKKNHDYMFGYPTNMIENSSMVSYLKKLETEMFFMNNCGNPEEQGNYQMDNKKQELEIVKLILKNLNLSINDYWGYITTGGTEGNIQGINIGFTKFPNGYLYYSKEAHYSINKCNCRNEKRKVIKEIDGKIDVDSLIKEIVNNYKTNKIPAIIFLTFGTTKTGAVDNIELIKEKLLINNIPNYIHVDAALYGGIPSNQNESPKLDFPKLEVDSISISFHKYLGITRCNGILIAKRTNFNNYIDYIGQNDTTHSGSRDFNSFSTYQQIKEIFERSSSFEYNENLDYFINKLNEYNIEYIRKEIKGNIFLINKPSDYLCKKYQLATFMMDNREYAHIIIFPFHSKEVIEEMVLDLYQENKKVLRK